MICNYILRIVVLCVFFLFKDLCYSELAPFMPVLSLIAIPSLMQIVLFHFM